MIIISEWFNLHASLILIALPHLRSASWLSQLLSCWAGSITLVRFHWSFFVAEHKKICKANFGFRTWAFGQRWPSSCLRTFWRFSPPGNRSRTCRRRTSCLTRRRPARSTSGWLNSWPEISRTRKTRRLLFEWKRGRKGENSLLNCPFVSFPVSRL